MESSERIIYIPLMERLLCGPKYCSLNEWEAWQWLLRKLNSPVSRNSSTSLRRIIEEDLEYRGTFSITVPVNNNKNPERPWIVNEILNQKGAFLLEYKIWYSQSGAYQSENVTFTYTVIL